MGGGAIVAALRCRAWRQNIRATSSCVIGTAGARGWMSPWRSSPTLWLAVPAMVVLGMAWISTANSLTLARRWRCQLGARAAACRSTRWPDGRLRGAALWGRVASWTSVPAAVLAAAIAGPLVLLLTRRLSVDGIEDEDLSPARQAARRPRRCSSRCPTRAGDGDAGAPGSTRCAPTTSSP